MPSHWSFFCTAEFNYNQPDGDFARFWKITSRICPKLPFRKVQNAPLVAATLEARVRGLGDLPLGVGPTPPPLLREGKKIVSYRDA